MIKQLFCLSMALMLTLILIGCSSNPNREKVTYNENRGCYVHTDKSFEKQYEEIEEGELIGVIMTGARPLGENNAATTLIIPQTIYEKDTEKEVVGISVDAIDRSIKVVESASAHFVVIDDCVYANSSTLVHIPYGKDTLNIPRFNTIILTYLSRCTGLNDATTPMVVNIPSTIEDIYIGKVAANIYWNVDNENPNYSSENGCLYDKHKSTLIRFYDQPDYALPLSVRKIYDYAFYQVKKLKKLTIAPEVETDRNYALDAHIIVNGALAGVFSVSPNKKVHFSQGNLQYQASTNTWRFAQNQYEFVGEANEKISITNDDWIDLFDMGTGNTPTKASYLLADYHPSTFVDWGKNRISNGGNIENGWHTLSAKEWSYLLNDRPNARNLQNHATIIYNGMRIYGYALLPDDCALPSDLHFRTDAQLDYDGNKNVYSLNEWERMETLGAVFLPCAGGSYHYAYMHPNGYKTEVSNLGEGHYWTTSVANTQTTYELFFSHTFIRFIESYNYSGKSVRLVK